MNKQRALITGINGQDGSYLAELLLSEDYEVHGLVRRASTNNLGRIQHILDKITLHEGDITDSLFVNFLINNISPQEIYNFAAQSHVQTSFTNPVYTYQTNTIGLLNILESVRQMGYLSNAKIYQASTSEMFGNVAPPQGLDSNFNPQSPYAISKLSAHDLIRFYRDTYNIFAVSGVLFNHESPRRGDKFVTRKITKYFGHLALGQEKLKLGNIGARRDWGFAPDYVRLIYNHMTVVEEPNDFVLGTGRTNSVRTFLDLVGEYCGVDWKKHVDLYSDEYMRPADVPNLQADSTYFVPTDLETLVKIMVDYDSRQHRDGYEYYEKNYSKIFAWSGCD